MAVDASLVLSDRHARFAALKAIIANQECVLKTKISWHSEWLYFLSGTTHITEALNAYGLKPLKEDTSGDVIIFAIHSNDLEKLEETRSSIREFVNGQEISFEEFNEETARKEQAIATIFKLTTHERAIASVEDGIIMKIACKNV